MKKDTHDFLMISLFKNYGKMAFRTLLKNKLTTFINITGLVIGLGGALLIGLFILDELAYDRHYKHKDQLYRLTSTYHKEGYIYRSAQTHSNIAPSLVQELPEIQAATRLLPADEAFLFSQEKAFKEDIIYTDSSFVKVFDLTLLIGNHNKCLTNPSSLLISEDMAIKLFGTHWQQQAILGETISIDGRIPLTITGVFKDLPMHSHFRSDLFASVPSGLGWMDDESEVYIYVLLHEQTNIDHLNGKLQALSAKLSSTKEDQPTQMNLQPITDIYLFSSVEDENGMQGNIKNIYALLIIAIFLIVITVINFVNLYTANSLHRLKEIGVRKAMGALNLQLRCQFLLETAFITLIALGIALVVAILFLPTFNELTDKHLSIASLLHGNVVFLIVGLTVVISLLAGFYPSFYLSAMKTVEALKGLKNKTTEIGVRKGLIVLQFAISCIMILLSIVAYKQMNLINNKPLGFDKENTLAIANPYMLGATENVVRFRNELLTVPGVEQVSITGYTPAQTRWGNQRITFPDKDEHSSYTHPAHWLIVDEGFIKTMGLDLITGRDFHENHDNDKEAIIINEKAVNQFHLNANGKSPVGAELSFKNEGEENYQTFTVIGVVGDFNFGSLHDPIKPLIMKLGYHRFEMALRLSPQYAEQETIRQVKAIWKRHLPLIPFEYSFIKNRFERLHKPDIAISKLFSAFCLLTIIMSALGLFSMVTYTIANRTKEIGIRKVMGASVSSILVLLSKEYIKLILIAFVIAIPVANYFFSEWLDNFAYRTEISWWIFVIPGVLVLLIALLSVGGQTIKAARRNPVESLRYE